MYNCHEWEARQKESTTYIKLYGALVVFLIIYLIIIFIIISIINVEYIKHLMETLITSGVISSRDGRFGSKVGQIGPKWDKSRVFSDQISVHLAPHL